MERQSLSNAYAYCQHMASSHYENFPVASFILPREIRQPISAVYAFARTADDFADEGQDEPEQRLAKLNEFSQKLEAIANGQAVDDPIFTALSDVIERFEIPLQLFEDLLIAFRQDVGKKRYANFGEVMDYCRHSANPVGRILLYLHRQATPKNLAYSDAICSALQLINFLQDTAQDYDENQRIYIPEDEMQRFHVTEYDLKHKNNTPATERLMAFQIDRTRQLLQSGAPLGTQLKGRFGLEIRLIIMGGSRVLQKLHENRQDMFARPRLTRKDKAWVVYRALIGGIIGR